MSFATMSASVAVQVPLFAALPGHWTQFALPVESAGLPATIWVQGVVGGGVLVPQTPAAQVATLPAPPAGQMFPQVPQLFTSVGRLAQAWAPPSGPQTERPAAQESWPDSQLT